MTDTQPEIACTLSDEDLAHQADRWRRCSWAAWSVEAGGGQAVLVIRSRGDGIEAARALFR